MGSAIFVFVNSFVIPFYVPKTVSKAKSGDGTAVCSEDKDKVMGDTGQEMDTAPVSQSPEENTAQCVQEKDIVSGTSAISHGDATSGAKAESNEMSACGKNLYCQIKCNSINKSYNMCFLQQN